MKYALKNAVILDGTKDMEPLRGQSVLVEGTLQGLQLCDTAGILPRCNTSVARRCVTRNTGVVCSFRSFDLVS